MTRRAPSGLQHERTVLAWSRTALSAAVLAILSLKVGFAQHSPVTIASGAADVVAAAAMLHGRRRRLAHSDRPPRSMAPSTAILVAIMCVIAAATTALDSLSHL